MTSQPLISVIIATADREHYLLESLASVLSQTYSEFEVLIVDQAVSRSLPDAIRRRFGNHVRVRYLHLDQGGLSRARNLGLQNARGEIVAFIDDDAMAEPDWLPSIAEAVTQLPKAGLVTGRILPIWLGERPRWYPKEREFLLGIYDIGDHVREMPEHELPFGGNMAGLRGLILQYGGFDERFGFNRFGQFPLLSGEDSLIAERIKKAGYLLYYHPQAAIRHRIGPQKLTRKYFLRRHFWEGVTTIRRMAVLGQVSAGMRKHYMYHAKATGMALARALLPGFENRYRQPNCVVRMLALSQAAFNSGVLYGLTGLHREQAANGMNGCASA